MRSLQEAGEFGGRKQSHVAGPPSPDNHCILLIHHFIENTGEVCTQTRVCCFPGHHGPLIRSVQHSCTATPGRALNLVREWAMMHGEELLEDRRFGRENTAPAKTEPLA